MHRTRRGMLIQLVIVVILLVILIVFFRGAGNNKSGGSKTHKTKSSASLPVLRRSAPRV